MSYLNLRPAAKELLNERNPMSVNTPEFVSVRISGSMTIHLDQTIRIPRQTFDRLNALWEQEDGLGVDDAEHFLDLLDLTEPTSVDYDDVDTFETVEPTPAC